MSAEGIEQGARFIPLADANSLQELFELSKSRAVVLFKHSTTCPISSAAYQAMTDFKGEVALLIVQRSRDLSRDVEARTGVRHESPQAIVLRNGQAVWNASHWKVRAEAVEKAVRENA
ncbi:MAG: bacillithiol system redox-active protein YtxJ [Pyrinomonadaceae bacterium]